MVYDLVHPDDYNRIQDWKHLHSAEQSDEVPRRHAVRIRFEGVKFAPRSESRNVQKHYYNYYLGNKKPNWASKVHPAGEVVFHNVYPDIDFETGRKNLYNLLDKGNEAIDGILNLAKEGEHPRAYEVAGQLIKTVSEVSQNLLDLQEKLKKIKDVPNTGPKSVTNALFVGSTTELTKLLKKKK